MLTKKIRANSKSINRIGVGICAITLTIMSILNAQAATPDVSYGDARIDAPVTPKNSVLVDFGHGGFLRVPKMLFAPGWNLPKDPDTPFKMGQISFVFQYPDMVLADYPSEMDLVFQKGEGGHYIPKPDRFPVHIVRLFYSPGELGNIDMDKLREKNNMEVPDFRPKRLLLNGEITAGLIKMKPTPKYDRDVIPVMPTIKDSPYKGLREAAFPVDPVYYASASKVWKEHGWDGVSHSTLYIEKADSPYELYMPCDDPSSIKCRAYVYSKSSHYQYLIIFPPEAVSHADDLIGKVNHMIDSWAKK